MNKFRKITIWWFTLAGFYFIVKSGLTPKETMITMPLYGFYVILGGWFASLGIIEYLESKINKKGK